MREEYRLFGAQIAHEQNILYKNTTIKITYIIALTVELKGVKH
jgi:hypothetical protein